MIYTEGKDLFQGIVLYYEAPKDHSMNPFYGNDPLRRIMLAGAIYGLSYKELATIYNCRKEFITKYCRQIGIRKIKRYISSNCI